MKSDQDQKKKHHHPLDVSINKFQSFTKISGFSLQRKVKLHILRILKIIQLLLKILLFNILHFMSKSFQ